MTEERTENMVRPAPRSRVNGKRSGPSNNQYSIKQERQFIPINDSKKTREDISIDDEPNKRKRQSMKVKEESIDNKKFEVKTEDDLWEREEFANKTSICHLFDLLISENKRY